MNDAKYVIKARARFCQFFERNLKRRIGSQVVQVLEHKKGEHHG
jgi:hypothetical protein